MSSSFLLPFHAVELEAPGSVLWLPTEPLLPYLICKGLLHIPREVYHPLSPDAPEGSSGHAIISPIQPDSSSHHKGDMSRLSPSIILSAVRLQLA